MIKLQPPNLLADGFLEFAKNLNEKSKAINTKFSEKEFMNEINSDFSGKIRFNFLLWVQDLNKVLDGMGLIESDLSDLKNDPNCMKGDPILRSEFLFQGFFGEFYRLKEISKIYISTISKSGLLNLKNKKAFAGIYNDTYAWVYGIRNDFIHNGLSFAFKDVTQGENIYKEFSMEDRKKYLSLLTESENAENTVQIYCAIYLTIMTRIMESFEKMQNKMMEVLADLIIEYEKIHFT